MKKYFLAALFILLAVSTLFAQQTDISGFYQTSVKTNTTGMYVLGGWAIANIAGGGIGWANSNGSAMYFHQMNLFWNTINLGIAGFALYNNLNSDISGLTDSTMMQKHIKTENLYLINAGLDVLYIGTGFFLKYLSTNNLKRKEMLFGYGNSVIVQGGFLLVFDLIMWAVQHNHRLDFLANASFSFQQNIDFKEIALSIRF
jgi:ligand-binding sensor domain-containing protein